MINLRLEKAIIMYPIGTKFKPLEHGTTKDICEVTRLARFDSSDNNILVGTNFLSEYVYLDGKWAKIVETKNEVINNYNIY